MEELISAILSLNEQEGREIFSRVEIEEGPTNKEDKTLWAGAKSWERKAKKAPLQ